MKVLYMFPHICYLLLISIHRRTHFCERHAVGLPQVSHVLCVDTGRSSETAKAHRG
eukprot:TRINITY_DN3830_c0_g2_i1.p3 TRINITY_DN3830_c0_g2~~TRINITY_DN3830_c0_g2_i1.p3  ORF type:complete len:56 (-),score=7.93 TRINITY_DN3830_c0_g2_i1:2-169(-)